MQHTNTKLVSCRRFFSPLSLSTDSHHFVVSNAMWCDSIGLLLLHLEFYVTKAKKRFTFSMFQFFIFRDSFYFWDERFFRCSSIVMCVCQYVSFSKHFFCIFVQYFSNRISNTIIPFWNRTGKKTASTIHKQIRSQSDKGKEIYCITYFWVTVRDGISRNRCTWDICSDAHRF